MMSENSSRPSTTFYPWAAWGGALVFIVLSVLVHFAIDAERARQEHNLRASVFGEAVHFASGLVEKITADVYLANGLVAYITAAPDNFERHIDVALRALHKTSPNLRNIGIAPGNRITHVYPLRGNEGAIGLYYPDIPAQWAAVKQAIDSHTTILAGPVNLVQGGSGLISRTPVYLENGSYWGIISLVIDTDTLFRSAGLLAQDNKVNIAIRGKDGLGAAGEAIFGDTRLFAEDSVLLPISVPGGEWQIAVSPKSGWSSHSTFLNLVEIIGIVLCFGLGFGAYFIQRSIIATKQSEYRLRIFLDTTQDAVIVIDDAGRVQMFNPAAEQMFGYSSDEIVNVSLNTLMPAQDASHHDQYISTPNKKKTRRMVSGREVNGVKKNGEIFPIEVTVGSADINGERHFVGVVRDISERKRSEKKIALTTERLETSQKIAHVGTWDWDIVTGGLDWSDEIYNIFRRSRDEFEATYENFLNCVHPDDREKVTVAVGEAVENDTSYDIEHRIVLPDGSVGTVHEMGTVYRDESGCAVRMLGVVHDITERAKLDIAKAEFISTVSHELRTPLTSVKGAVGILAGGALGELPEKAQSMADLALRNTDRLLALVNDILDLEKMQSGKMDFNFSVCDLPAIVSESVKDNVGFADKNGVMFNLVGGQENIPVMADKDRLTQVLTNLLSNAAKFSCEGGVVDISVERQGQVAKVSVIDQGAGISQDFHDQLFQRFSQEDNSDRRKNGGTGLGLNISKTIIDRHGGVIGFESEIGKGSTFYFTLPIAS